jgi:hypothetical protein
MFNNSTFCEILKLIPRDQIKEPGYAVDSISDAILQLTPLGNLCNL